MPSDVADTIQIIFSASGISEVSKAFESVESRMARFEKASSQQASAGVKERIRGANTERKERESVYAQLFKQIDAKEKESAKLADKAARDKAKADANAARERLRSEQNLARDRQRIIDNSARYAGRVAEEQANKEIREAERAARKRQQIAEREARESRSRNARMGSSAGSFVGSSLSRGLGMAGGLAGAALAIGGGASFADSIRGQLEAEKAAAVLSNSAYIKGAAGASGVRVDPKALLAKASSIQGATNFSKSDILAGMQSYVAKTGSAELLAEDDKSVLEMAQLAKASGSQLSDVMGAAGILRSQNANLTTEQSSEMMRNIVAQGKMGSVEMSDLASIAGKITASSAMYKGSQTDAQRSLLGLSQIAIKTAGSPEEAATAITKLGSDALAMANGKKGDPLGLVDKKTGLLASPEEIISKVMGANQGNIGKIQKMGFGERSIKLFEALAPTYQNAYGAAKGTEAERVKAASEAVRKEVTGFTAAKFSKEDVANDLSVVMSQRAEKIDQTMNRLKEILAEKGLPIFERFMNTLEQNMPAIERNIGKLADLLAWFASNPFEGLGALVIASVGKDIASAGIGKAVSMAITASLNGGQAALANPRSLLPSGVGAAGGGGSIGAAAGGAVVAATVVGALAAKDHIDTLLDSRSAGQNQAISTAMNLGNVQRALKAGQISPEEAKKKLAEAQALMDKGQNGPGLIEQHIAQAGAPLDFLASKLGFGDNLTGATGVAKAAGESAGVRAGEKQLADAMKELTKALSAQSGKTGGGMANPADPARVPKTAQ